jgi:hypothetical protein
MPIKKIKQNALKRRIKSGVDKKNRELKLQSWATVKTIGFLYIVPDEQEYIKFTSFINSLQAEKKEIKALGLLTTKEMPHYCYPRLSFDYFSRKETNWYGKPVGSKVNDFVDTPFDLLINLDLSGNLVFDCIVSISAARLKAGIFRKENAAPYDLMIDDSSVSDSGLLIEHVISWIKTLCP